jgi:hypothetical protein
MLELNVAAFLSNLEPSLGFKSGDDLAAIHEGV